MRSFRSLDDAAFSLMSWETPLKLRIGAFLFCLLINHEIRAFQCCKREVFKSWMLVFNCSHMPIITSSLHPFASSLHIIHWDYNLNNTVLSWSHQFKGWLQNLIIIWHFEMDWKALISFLPVRSSVQDSCVWMFDWLLFVVLTNLVT